MNEDQILQEHIKSAPTAIRKLIVSDANEKAVEQIGAKQNLDSVQISQLDNEITMVLLGLEPLSAFRTNLVQELDITYDQALKIAFDANAQVFAPVMDILRQMEVAIQRGELIETGTPQKEEKPVRSSQQSNPSNPFLPNLSKTGVKNSEMDPDHMLMDHDEMEKVDGPHLHSQNVMPTGSMVDQKLSRIFKSPTTPVNPPANPPKPQTKSYVKDPYREPLN